MTADFSAETAFDVLAPAQQRVPFVFNSPHSGRVYPQRFLDLAQLDGWQIRRSEDCFVDELFMGAVALGAPAIKWWILIMVPAPMSVCAKSRSICC